MITDKNKVGAEVLVVLIAKKRQDQAHEEGKHHIDNEGDHKNLVKKHVFFGRIYEHFEEFGPIQHNESRNAPHQGFEDALNLPSFRKKGSLWL